MDFFLEFPCYRDEHTGMVEITDLTDIDRAVSSFIQGLFGVMTVTDVDRPENKEFARYADRGDKYKLFYGQFDDPNDFLSKVAAKIGIDIDKKRNAILPTAYISRDPSISFADGSDYVDATNIDQLANDNGVYATVNQSFVKLNYTVTGVAWSRPTLERMMLGLMLWLRHAKKGRKHTFTAKTMLAGAQVESTISVLSRKEVVGDVVEIPREQNRIVAMSVSLEVVAEIYEAEEVVRNIGAVQVVGAVPLE